MKDERLPYNLMFLLSNVIWFGVVVVLMKMTKGVGFAIVIVMTYFGLLMQKTEKLFFWMIVAVCMLIANPYIVTKSFAFAWMQRGLMLSLGGIMAFGMLAHHAHRVAKPYLLLLVYVFYMILPSTTGYCPIISYLKLLLFVLIYCTYFGVANQVGISNTVSSKNIRSVMLAVASFFILGSICLISSPIGQMDPEEMLLNPNMTSLFMGMTNQSQCLGPIVATLAVVLLADMLFSIKKIDKFYVLLLLCCPVLMYKTSSRTGMGAYLLGQCFVGYVFLKARGLSSHWKSKMLSCAMGLLCLLVVVVLCSSNFSTNVVNFALKRTRDDNRSLTVENVIMTRQGLVDVCMANFKKSPLFGNGFQVSENMVGRKINGLASVLSAPIEKGVWLVAILEEGGVFGMALFLIFVLTAMIKGLKNRAYISSCCLFVMLLTNLGEFTMFSMSYTGGAQWAIVFMGLALDLRRFGDDRDQQMMARYGDRI